MNINAKMFELLKSIYPKIVAEQLTSVQSITSNFNDELRKEIVIPEFYQQIIDEISSMKTNFRFIHYDNRFDKISGHINLVNYDTHIFTGNLKSESIKDKYFDMYKEDIDIIKNICKNYNVNVEFKLSDLHCFAFGWCNIIDMEIKKKDENNG
jgi:hypothetical protein